MNNIPTSNKGSAFVRLPSGAIYYGKDGAYHQIQTYATFLNMGGNASNTLDVPYDFLQYSTAGNPIQ
jgi:hypothetical protein